MNMKEAIHWLSCELTIPHKPEVEEAFKLAMDILGSNMRMFTIVKEGAKCGGCNWEASHQYVIATTEKEAKALYRRGEAGLCGDCMSDMLVEGSENYEFIIVRAKRTPATK